MKCVYCNKTLRKFNIRPDWQTRPMHLKCWKEIRLAEQQQRLIEKYGYFF